MFVDTGIYAGKFREYNNNTDIRTGLTREEILSKNYSIKEYQLLLRDIEKYNTKYYKKYIKDTFTENELNKLKISSDQKLSNDINALVKNVAIVLNKNKQFIDKYVALIRKCGVFENKYDLKLTDKDKIKYIENENKKRLDYIKKLYITKIKKYLSIIKNGISITDNINIKFVEDDAILLDLQSDIYNENIKLEMFLNEDIRKNFMSLTIDYTNDEINSIYGIDNIYNNKYDKIKVYSSFNFKDAANVLLHMVITQLNRFIVCSLESYDNKELVFNEDVYNSNVKNVKCRNICQFIVVILEELDSDNEIFNICSDGTEQIKNSLIQDYYIKKSKLLHKDVDYVSEQYTQLFSKDEEPDDSKEVIEDPLESDTEGVSDEQEVYDLTETDEAGYSELSSSTFEIDDDFTKE